MACRHQYHDYGKTQCWRYNVQCPYRIPNEQKCDKDRRLNAVKNAHDCDSDVFVEN